MIYLFSFYDIFIGFSVLIFRLIFLFLQSRQDFSLFLSMMNYTHAMFLQRVIKAFTYKICVLKKIQDASGCAS